jgi:CRISPR system Cascade subunit CasA
VTGDPWTPIDRRKDGKALTMDGSGFHYRRVVNLLDAKLYEAPPLQKWHSSDGKNGNSLAMVVIVRGEGGTDGFHERSIAIPPGCVLIFGEHPDELAKIARERVDDAGKVRRGVLRTAIFVLLQNAPKTSDLQNTACETKAEPFLSAFDRDVDRHFFDALFEELGAVDGAAAEKARKTWLLRLKDLAVRQFEAAVAGTPRSSIRRYQAEAAGRSALEATFRKRFPNAVENKP